MRTKELEKNKFPWVSVLIMVLSISVLLNSVLLVFYFDLDEECLEKSDTRYTATYEVVDKANSRIHIEEANFTDQEGLVNWFYRKLSNCEEWNEGYNSNYSVINTFRCTNEDTAYTITLKTVEPVCLKTVYIYKGG